MTTVENWDVVLIHGKHGRSGAIKLRGLFSHGKNGWAGVDGWMDVWTDGWMYGDGWEKEWMRMNGGDDNERNHQSLMVCAAASRSGLLIDRNYLALQCTLTSAFCFRRTSVLNCVRG